MFNTLEKRSLLTLCTLYFSRMVGLFIIIPVLSVYAVDFQYYSPATLGVALGIYGLTQGLLLLPFGILSDLYGRRKLLLIGLLLFAFGSIIAALATDMYQLIIGRALQGMGAIAGVLLTVTSELIRSENRAIAMGIIGASIGVSFAVGIVISPILADQYGLSGLFWVCLFLAIFCIGLVMSLPLSTSEIAPNTLFDLVKQIRSQIFTDHSIMQLNIGIFLAHLLQMALWVVVPVILLEDFGVAKNIHWQIYLLVMGSGFVCMMGLLSWVNRFSQHTYHTIVFSISALIVGLLLMMIKSSQIVFLFGLFIFFFGFCFIEARFPSILSHLYQPHMRGTTMSCFSTFQFLGVFVGGVFGGAIVYFWGERFMFMALTVLTIFWWLYYTFYSKPVRVNIDRTDY